jgi:UDP-N-acetylmuramyl pentapeptide phosphotransferase/UDP-N-acetylglucosamine-1-phosphate transferase
MLQYYVRIAKIIKVYDYPISKRKIHKTKTPLIGGILLLINLIFINFLYFFFNDIYVADLNKIFGGHDKYFLFLFASLIIFLIGFLDDKINLNANLKFFFFIAIAVLSTYLDHNLLLETIDIKSWNININLPNIGFVFTVLCFLLFINAANMYDGINLQSGPYFFGVYSYLLYKFGINSFFLMILIFLVIFVLLNARGKIFFGNSGIYLISFITSYIAIKQYNNLELISIEEIFLIMCIPGYDMLRLFISRCYQMRSPFSSDKNHIHHIILKTRSIYFAQVFLFILNFTPIFIGSVIGYDYGLILSFFIYITVFYFFWRLSNLE